MIPFAGVDTSPLPSSMFCKGALRSLRPRGSGRRAIPLIRAVSVAVGLSGGVDSAVSAYLLKEKGYDVTAVYMKNWSIEEESGQSVCPLKDDLLDAQKIAEFLHIPLEIVDFEREYWLNVFSPCLELYKDGGTPNPDVLCNRYIKFDAFTSRFLNDGFDYVATGHYCQVNTASPLSPFSSHPGELLRGIDGKKDQSYFLSQINGALLPRILFPVGHMKKADVKALARQVGIHVAAKKESVGICFIGERNMKSFLSDYLDSTPGKVITTDGLVLGQHDGLLFYTIGQGMHLANQRAKYYVCEKRTRTNELVVCEGLDPALFKRDVVVDGCDVVWMQQGCLQRILDFCGEHPDDYPIQCVLRYQTTAYPCRLASVLPNGNLCIQSKEPMRAVTPGQVCVFYDGNVCLGGGRIRSEEGSKSPSL